MLKYTFRENKEIKSLLVQLDELQVVYETMPRRLEVEENLRRESLLKSSVFSARIEGNPMTVEQIKSLTGSAGKDVEKLEVLNLYRAYKYVYSKSIGKRLTLPLILKLHGLVLKNISPDAGSLRQEPGAIFNAAGVAVYVAPPPDKIKILLNDLIKLSQDWTYEIPIRAALAHFLFEKIHPFIDGNGRVGRLISAYLLKIGGYGFTGLTAHEEYIESHRERYYAALEPNKSVDMLVESYLESLVISCKKTLNKLRRFDSAKPEDSLLPRRKEILFIIRDHPYCSFDFIARRFRAVNPKTLHYDLKKLQDAGFVQKVGVTRGVMYKVRR